jgi:hypothetical protein
MALPTEYDTVLVYREYVYHDGSYPTGEVDFTPNVKRQRATVSGRTVLPKKFTATLDANGRIEIALPATDDPDISNPGWTYTVNERFTGGQNYQIDVPISAKVTGLDLGTVDIPVPSAGDPTTFVTLSAFNDAIAGIDGGQAIVVDVREHGAVGDDSTDNAAAIQAALDQVKVAGGGTVLIPEGTYRTGPITLSSRSRLVGVGFGSILKAVSGSTGDLISTEDSTVELFQVADLALDCWGQVAGSGAAGIRITSNSVGYPSGYPDAHHSLRDVMIVGSAGPGLAIASGGREIRAHNVTVRDPRGGHGFDVQGTDNFFSMCTVATSRTPYHGFYVHGSNNRFLGCKAFYCGQTGEASDGWFVDRGRNSFFGCEAQDNGRWGFQFNSGTDQTTAAGLLADSNAAGGIKIDNAGGTMVGFSLSGFSTFSRSGGRYAQPVGIRFQGASHAGNLFVGTATANTTTNVDGVATDALTMIASA